MCFSARKRALFPNKVGKWGYKVAGIKATCDSCDQTMLLFFDPNDTDCEEISALKEGEMFEQKCPVCCDWTVFTKGKQYDLPAKQHSFPFLSGNYDHVA